MSTKINAATRLVTAANKQVQYLDLRISGSPEAIQTITNLLAVIEWNCQVGHSATVGAFFDGDGADKITIEGIPDANKKLGRDMAQACSSYGDDILARIASGTAAVLNTVYKEGVESVRTTVVYPPDFNKE